MEKDLQECLDKLNINLDIINIINNENILTWRFIH